MIHPEVFNYLSPTDEQKLAMQEVRDAAKVFADVLIEAVPDGPDKTYLIRKLRELTMWANVGITRLADGAPRS